MLIFYFIYPSWLYFNITMQFSMLILLIGVKGFDAFFLSSSSQFVVPIQNREVTQHRIFVWRARSPTDRDGWISQLQAAVALMLDNSLIDQADNRILNFEEKKSAKQIDNLNNLATLDGVLGNFEARMLLAEFLKTYVFLKILRIDKIGCYYSDDILKT